MQWYLMAIRQYADFKGRAGRTEFWVFTLFNVIIALMLALIDAALGTPLYLIYLVAVLVPSWAAAARRLHDVGRSGWWQLIGFVPVIGSIILIIWLASASRPGPNRWGTSPMPITRNATVAY